jgi:hypothetical protein
MTTPTELVRRIYEAINVRDYEAGFALLGWRLTRSSSTRC